MTSIVQTLDDARELITPLLRKVVHRLDPSTRLVVSYHLGWCDEHGIPVNTNGGKAIRPAIALLGAQSAGAEPESALPGAVAVELVHNFSLVHDDLMDRDSERRHRATVWAQWDDATAVLAGDAMLSLAHEVLLDVPTPHARAAEMVVAIATRELIRGQALDVAFESRRAVSLDECVAMARGKTGPLMSASAAIGAVLAGAPTVVTDALAAYGDHVGLAFQLVDDLLGIWGRPEITGKPVYSDLRSHKKTLPVTWAIENGGTAGRELAHGWPRRSATRPMPNSPTSLSLSGKAAGVPGRRKRPAAVPHSPKRPSHTPAPRRSRPPGFGRWLVTSSIGRHRCRLPRAACPSQPPHQTI